jgi:hypothetical protein
VFESASDDPQHSGEWVEIVAPAERAEAEARFSRWKAENPITRAGLSAQDIRIDTIRSEGGKVLVRYLIRSK